ncbi:MAG: hypothetical protein ACLFM1_10440 [Bacteroidales bacterium]
MDKEEYKRKIRAMAMDDRYISGIHNYCDRWCERCTFTSRCRVFSMEQADNGDRLSQDMENQEFWERIRLNFEVAAEMLQEMADDAGIELLTDDEDTPPNFLEQPETPIEKLAKKYGFSVSDWLAPKMETISGHEDPAVRDSAEVIRWYSLFIGVKITRSLMKDFSLQDDPEMRELWQNDQLGSAKIALIAIQRSIEALSVLYKTFPEWEDEVLEFLRQLSRMKRTVEVQFQGAWDFKRPGFDTQDA